MKSRVVHCITSKYSTVFEYDVSLQYSTYRTDDIQGCRDSSTEELSYDSSHWSMCLTVNELCSIVYDNKSSFFDRAKFSASSINGKTVFC